MSEGVTIESGEPHFLFIAYDISDPVFRARLREYIKAHLFVAHNYSLYYGPWNATLFAEVKKWAAEETAKFRADPKNRGVGVDIRVIPTAVSQADFIELFEKYEQKFKQQWGELEGKLDETDEMIIGNILKQITGRVKEEDPKSPGTFVWVEKVVEERPFTVKEILQRIKHSEHLIGVLEEALMKQKEIEQQKWQENPKRQEQHDELYKQIRTFVLRIDSQRKSVESRIAREKAKEAAEKGQQPLPKS